MEKIFQQRLKDMFSYNEKTGQLIRSVNVGKCKAGDAAGSQHPDGYRYIKLDRVRYSFHRLVWMYVYGVWPTHQIDHINGIKIDNRISNLRDVTQSVNLQNKKTAHSSNKSGLLGASFDHKCNKYIASIQVDGVKKYIGCFDSPQDAHQAYLNAKRDLHIGCTI